MNVKVLVTDALTHAWRWLSPDAKLRALYPHAENPRAAAEFHELHRAWLGDRFASLERERKREAREIARQAHELEREKAEQMVANFPARTKQRERKPWVTWWG